MNEPAIQRVLPSKLPRPAVHRPYATLLCVQMPRQCTLAQPFLCFDRLLFAYKQSYALATTVMCEQKLTFSEQREVYFGDFAIVAED